MFFKQNSKVVLLSYLNQLNFQILAKFKYLDLIKNINSLTFY